MPVKATALARTGMSTNDHDNYLWDTFSEFWPPWVKHVDHWEPRNEESIEVFFKEDGYITNGAVYIFGEKGRQNWFLNRIQGPKEMKMAEGGTF